MGTPSKTDELLHKATRLESGKWTPVGFADYADYRHGPHVKWLDVEGAPLTLSEAHALHKIGAVSMASQRTYEICKCCGMENTKFGNRGRFFTVVMPKGGALNDGK